jgi:hypothetical protein
MVRLSAGLNSSVPLTLKEKATLANPVYVIVFVNDNTKAKFACVITDTGSYPDRWQMVNITVQTSPNWLLGQVNLDGYGHYHYYAYETTSVVGIVYNTLIAADLRDYVPDYFTTLLETGKMKYLTDDETRAYYQDLNTAVTTYGK